MSNDCYPQFPLYIPTKGRSQYLQTSKELTKQGVHHHLVVEPQEASAYQEAIDRWDLDAEVLRLDMEYKSQYDTCDDHGLTKSTGPGPARNFAWDHAIANGFDFHWVMDDNINGFYRFHKNKQIKCYTPAFWRAMEDFVLRYKNVAMAGPNYHGFMNKRSKAKPFTLNTRIYSCNFIRNDVPFRWRGRYNEDTILSLDMLKAGWCTIQFNAFLQDKIMTQQIKGGNTDEFYHAEGEKKGDERYAKGGTYNKSKMMVDVHPDVSEIVHKFGRIHHQVDYTPFKRNKLVKRDDVDINSGTNNYGMRMKRKKG